ncbi:hypothetical protein INS49_005602 [Diaporthe citri]|uniref:uncharacterized protein n=1 Tax=Diaporthe citri TaxID=83186 RepID=UPI001C7F1B95|nr:uncharacterized protein INS49_005602 [Diaporthe citri]KAG6353421.1 hypothetical protein INS49_005602 [Diaporthe citri]
MYAYHLWAKPPTQVDRLEGGEGTHTTGGGARILGRIDARSASGVDGGSAGGEHRTDRTAAGAEEGTAASCRQDEGVVSGGAGAAADSEGLAGEGREAASRRARDPANISLSHGLYCGIIQSLLLVNTLSRGK